MAILNVSYNAVDQIALLQPINAIVPEGFELIGKTGTGVTYYDAVKFLLEGIGIRRMANVTIKFDDLTATLAVLNKKPTIEPEEETSGVAPVVKTSIFK